MGPTIYPADNRLKRLHKNCEITLERFISLAHESCTIAGKLRALPVSKDRRLAIFQQRKREDEALAAYQKARHELLAAVESGALDNPQDPVEPRSHGTPRVGMHRRRTG